ncbi:MAG: accessory Sec system protein Asp3 [Intestinibaculum porci]|uniref:accessory Sec system protein Asp3 n=1 Tax=Intestinibaculum porci TaxID=2487118 RepID=UPI003F01EDC1
MAKSTIYMITWESLNEDSYLYGAHIEKKEGYIVYSQPLMPPGGIIKKWVSQTNYQKDRHEPGLPSLKEGHTYHLHAYMKAKPSHSCFMRLNFYDYYGELIDFVMTSEDTCTFTCPQGIHYYELLLIKGNAQDLVFERIDLFEKEITHQFDHTQSEVTILVLEPQGSMLKVPEEALLKKLGNVLILPARSYSNKLSYVIDHQNEYQVIRIVGYGPVSNGIVKELLQSLKNAKGYIYNESFGKEHDHFFSEALSDHTKRLLELPFLKGE